MSTPPYQLPPNASPLGTLNPVMPTAPNQPMLPGQTAAFAGQMPQGQGIAYVQGQQPGIQYPGMPQGTPNGRPNVMRPEILEQVMQQQAQAADPQMMAEQANQLRLEQIISESNERASRQSEQLNQAVTMLSQSTAQQAEFQRQQLEIAQSQQAIQQQAALANQLQPWQDPSLQLNAEQEATFEESLPVINSVARRNALQAAHETVASQVSPEIAALRQEIAQLNTRVQTNTQVQAQSFADDLLDVATEHGLNLDQLERQPEWIAYKREISNPFTQSIVDQDLNAALASGQKKDLRVIRTIFKNFVERTTQQNSQQQDGGNELPPQSGNARVNTAQQQQAPVTGAADITNQVGQQHHELEVYRSQLMDGLRRGKIDIGHFQSEIARVEDGVNQLISSTQQPN